jgi:U6 snRNA-associated Sm-like protein LSm6
LDGFMNIALEQTGSSIIQFLTYVRISEEYHNGQLKRKYGDAFLRGNNVLYISVQKR